MNQGDVRSPLDLLKDRVEELEKAAQKGRTGRYRDEAVVKALAKHLGVTVSLSSTIVGGDDEIDVVGDSSGFWDNDADCWMDVVVTPQKTKVKKKATTK